jgi:hypothetical protein
MPGRLAPFVWETAMYDAARLFRDFGIELERLAWKPDDLFGLPHGLVWFIKGNYAAAIGATRKDFEWCPNLGDYA